MADITRPNDAREAVGEQTRAQRESFIKNAKGDAVGNNWLVPKSDFGAFLGYKPASPAEMSGEQPMTGARVIELALQKEAKSLGLGAAKNGNEYRNIHIAWGRFGNEPGREKDMIKDGLDSFHAGPEKGAMEDKLSQMSPATQQYLHETRRMQKDSHNDNVRYLEMQYRFQEMGKQETVISNLMKKRHDSHDAAIKGSGTG